jgi:hypothetical protein
MFLLYMALFVLGFYLFGLGMTIESGYVFTAGILAVSAALALVLHLPAARERHDR